MRNMITRVMVSDMERSVQFYRDTLGLKLRFQSPDWTEFDLGTTTLALHGGGKPAPPGTGPPESIGAQHRLVSASITSMASMRNSKPKAPVL